MSDDTKAAPSLAENIINSIEKFFAENDSQFSMLLTVDKDAANEIVAALRAFEAYDERLTKERARREKAETELLAEYEDRKWWRCFHCGYVCRTSVEAAAHFGKDLTTWNNLKKRCDDAEGAVKAMRDIPCKHCGEPLLNHQWEDDSNDGEFFVCEDERQYEPIEGEIENLNYEDECILEAKQTTKAKILVRMTPDEYKKWKKDDEPL